MKISLVFGIFCAYVVADKPNLWIIDQVLPPVELKAYSQVLSGPGDFQMMKVGCSCINNDETCVMNNVKINNRENSLNCEGYQVSLIKSVRFINSVVNYLPNDLKQFTNLENLQIENSNLVEVTQNDLKDFPKLKNLVVSGNQIVSLEENLFEFNERVEKLDFERNSIKYIHPQLFAKLTNLVALQLDDNDCMSCSAYQKDFLNFVLGVALENCSTPLLKVSRVILISLIIGVISIIGIIVGLAIFVLYRKRMMTQSILSSPSYQKDDDQIIPANEKKNNIYSGGKFNHGYNYSLNRSGEETKNVLKLFFRSLRKISF